MASVPPPPTEEAQAGNWWAQQLDKAKAFAKETQQKVQASPAWQQTRESLANERRVVFEEQELGLTIIRHESTGKPTVSCVQPASPAADRGVVVGAAVTSIQAVRPGGLDDPVACASFDEFSALFPAMPRPVAVTFQLPQRTRALGVVNFTLEEELAKTVTMVKLLVRERFTNPMLSVPRHVLDDAKGLAFLRVAKIGFGLSATMGTGLVVARTGTAPDAWSAPCAIGTGGLGWGLQLGAELTDLLLVLNTDEAVTAFASGHQLTLGGNVGIAAGPIGRRAAVQANVANKHNALPKREATADTSPPVGDAAEDEAAQPQDNSAQASFNKAKAASKKALQEFKPMAAAVYSYSASKGLFVGISLEGAVITPRADVNEKFYGGRKPPRELLSPATPPPVQATELYRVLASALTVEHNPDDGPPPAYPPPQPFQDAAAEVVTTAPAPAVPAPSANPWGEDEPAASLADGSGPATAAAEPAAAQPVPVATPAPAPSSASPASDEPEFAPLDM